MLDLFRSVTARSVLETLFCGKPGASAKERRNYLVWGHPAPRAEHKVILLLALVFTALALVLIAVNADAAPRDDGRVPAAGQGTHIILLGPARPLA